MLTSLVRPEMVYPNKKYESYCLKVSESEPVAQYEPVSSYQMDGLQPRIDLKPDAKVPTYPEDEVDADPRFNEYPPEEEFVEGPDWTPGQIPPIIHSPEYTGSSSDTSMDTQAVRAMQAVSVSAEAEPLDGAATSTSAGGDTRKVELDPLPGLSQQFTRQMEWEIQKQIEEQSRKIVEEVLQRSANRIIPRTPSESSQASLSQCFQKALATPLTKPAPPPEPPKEQAMDTPAEYSLADPFARINPPPPDILTGGHSDQPSRGRTTQRSEQPRSDYPPDKKKRRSNSHPRGEADPKRGQSSVAEPSWDTLNIGAWQSNKARSQPAGELEAPGPTPKLKSIVKKVRMDLPEPGYLESLGPAARSRYDDSSKDDQSRRDRSRHRADASVCPKDVRRKSRSGAADKGSSHSEGGSGKHDRRSGQGTDQKSSTHKEDSLGAKLLAHKEREKWYKKIVDNPVLYLEERQHQILPEEHEPEIDSLRFFGSRAERATIQILALIDWAAEYVEIS